MECEYAPDKKCWRFEASPWPKSGSESLLKLWKRAAWLCKKLKIPPWDMRDKLVRFADRGSLRTIPEAQVKTFLDKYRVRWVLEEGEGVGLEASEVEELAQRGCKKALKDMTVEETNAFIVKHIRPRRKR